jgi:hypothetical protein
MASKKRKPEQRLPSSKPEQPSPPPKMEPPLPPDLVSQLRIALREENKKLILPTILGSTRLATVITVVSNFWVESYKIRAQTDLIRLETTLQLKKQEVADRKEAYSKLHNDFTSVQNSLFTLVKVCEDNMKNPGRPPSASGFETELDELTEKMGEVYTGIESALVDDETRKRIGNILDSLAPRLAEIQGKPKRIPSFISDYYQNLRSTLHGVKKDMEEKMNSLS